LRLRFAQARLLEGEIARLMGHAGEAKNAWNKARELLAADSKQEVAFDRLDLLVRTLQWLGQDSEAAASLQRLNAAGYVPSMPWPGKATPLASVPARSRHGAHANDR
jgi:eukaryotic-like serine/threonine-protein kinase